MHKLNRQLWVWENPHDAKSERGIPETVTQVAPSKSVHSHQKKKLLAAKTFLRHPYSTMMTRDGTSLVRKCVDRRG
jgi:hypothetical protein